MKRIHMLAACLILGLLLAACGTPVPEQQPADPAASAAPAQETVSPENSEQETGEAPDMQALYAQIEAAVEMPEMVSVPDKRREALFGIVPEDSLQIVTMICGDSVRADEVWLVEAVDEEAAERIAGMAQLRLDQRAQEMENYLPDQYAVVQQAKLLREGRFVALLISPEAGTMETLFLNAVRG